MVTTYHIVRIQSTKYVLIILCRPNVSDIIFNVTCAGTDSLCGWMKKIRCIYRGQ